MADRIEAFNKFREEYPVFNYTGYGYTQTRSSLDITYHFDIPGLCEFHPSWSFSVLNPDAVRDGGDRLNELVFSLGMAELVSYWKTVCSPRIHIENKNLSPEQIQWWTKLYTKGLGEFYYTYGIPAGNEYMHITCPHASDESAHRLPDESNDPGSRLYDAPDGSRLRIPARTSRGSAYKSDGLPQVLVPIGGGKDSAVTLELLRGAADRTGYIINPRKATTGTAAAAGMLDKTITAKRSLDSRILSLNAQGYLNGHTPFSAVVAFSAVLAAYVNGLEYVALSNESSANEATVPDSDVNHQYSKSFEFEEDFRAYQTAYLRSGVEYFSLLRPLTELRIAQLFASYREYHRVFKSCNAGSKTDIWCGNCPKCLFVYIILSPFMDEGALIDIFGRNLLDDERMLDYFEKLTGLQPEKPFECVGARDEVKAALRMTLQKHNKDCRALPLLLQYFSDKFPTGGEDGESILHSFDHRHALPDFCIPLLA